MANHHIQRPITYVVKTETTLLSFLTDEHNGISRNKAKAILKGGGVKVNGKISTRHDTPLLPNTTVEICRHKPAEQLNNKFVKIVYEDPFLIVIEKNVGILSMAANHHAFSVKSVLDEYFRRSKQKCTAHVVHRLDRDLLDFLFTLKPYKRNRF